MTLKPEFRRSSSSSGNASSVVLGKSHFTSTGGVRQESLRKAERCEWQLYRNLLLINKILTVRVQVGISFMVSKCQIRAEESQVNSS